MTSRLLQKAPGQGIPSLGFGLSCAGFYAPESGAHSSAMAWMGRCGAVKIPSRTPGALEITGVHYGGFFEKAFGDDGLIVELYMEGALVGSIALSGQGVFQRSIALAPPEGTGSVALGLKALRTFVPARLGENGDERELSFQVASIRWNDEIVFGFGKSEGHLTAVKRRTADIPGVNLVGYVRGEFGIGQSVRNAALALEAASIPFCMIDFNEGSTSRAADGTWAHKLADSPTYPISVFHITADQIPLARAKLGEEFFRDRYNIGYWHWELPVFPDEWLGAFSLLDEVWAPSSFVAEALAAKSPIPIVKIPHALKVEATQGACRSLFGLPNGRFFFLLVFDMHSSLDRKNPGATIRAFQRAFPGSENVGLVIKTQNTWAHPESLRELEEAVRSDSRVMLIDKTLSRQEVFDLESVCDCFVSLHRSEGFGLGLAEAMLLKKPVIGTNWSANTDFMTQGNSCPIDYELVPVAKNAGPYRRGQIWAEADVGQAARYMRRIVSNRPWREIIARKGLETAVRLFSPVAVGRLVAERLRIIQEIQDCANHNDTASGQALKPEEPG